MRWSRIGSAVVLLALVVASSADAGVSFEETCSEKAVAHCGPLAAACGQARRCLSAHRGEKGCPTRGIDLDAALSCAPCRTTVATLREKSAACAPSKPAVSAPAPAAPSVSPPATAPSPAPPAPPPPTTLPAVPQVPKDCQENLPQVDLAGLVADSSWGYCSEKVDCPCTYAPCTVPADYAYASVVEPSFVDAANPGWSKTKVKNGPGKHEWMYCTVRTCKISSTSSNTDGGTWLRCWSKPIAP